MTLAAPGRPAWRAGAVFLAAFALLLFLGWRTPPRDLSVFDQRFYAVTAWDVATRGVFTDGYFARQQGPEVARPAGMWLAPGYPLLLAGLVQLDPALREATTCLVRRLGEGRTGADCPVARGLVLPVNMALVAGAVVLNMLAAARVAHGMPWVPLVAAAATLAALLPYVRTLSLAMTESLGLFLFALAAFLFLAAWQGRGRAMAAAAGLALGLLVLTRPSHVVLIPLALLTLAVLPPRGVPWRRGGVLALAFGLGVGAATLPWMLRNEVALGRFGLTANYGPAVLTERLAYNRMTPTEFAQSFVYWLPDFGDRLAERLFGRDLVEKLDWDRPNSFYMQGQADRQAALDAPGELQDRMGAILRDGVLGNPVAHGMATVSLAWRGLWVGRYWAFVMLGLLPLGLGFAAQAGMLRPLLVYAAPAWVMLWAHAALSVNQERYNLALALGLAIATALATQALLLRRRERLA
ncbi:hypothetical protein ACE7GA_21040 [Roseomonas sp. CCTCC AB2023176]|uniref:hypothetical protein n=1 Tax=Roseomonas sp. CCTCC AB2023176 TaxID=3342640 RepID=UPI0035E0F3ED